MHFKIGHFSESQSLNLLKRAMNVKLTLSREEEEEKAAHKRHSRSDSWEIKMDVVMLF